MDLKRWIRDAPDFPKPGILVRAITPLLQDPDGLRLTLDRMGEIADELKPDLVSLVTY